MAAENENFEERSMMNIYMQAETEMGDDGVTGLKTDIEMPDGTHSFQGKHETMTTVPNPLNIQPTDELDVQESSETMTAVPNPLNIQPTDELNVRDSSETMTTVQNPLNIQPTDELDVQESSETMTAVPNPLNIQPTDELNVRDNSETTTTVPNPLNIQPTYELDVQESSEMMTAVPSPLNYIHPTDEHDVQDSSETLTTVPSPLNIQPTDGHDVQDNSVTMTTDPNSLKILIDVQDSSGNFKGHIPVNTMMCLRLLQLSLNKASDNQLKELVEDLQPAYKDQTMSLFKSLREKGAEICEDEKGRLFLRWYEDRRTSEVWADASVANTIVKPKTDNEQKDHVNNSLNLINYMKRRKWSSGVVLGSSHVSIRAGHYREGEEFTYKITEETADVHPEAVYKKCTVGKGNTAGDIVVVKDKITKQEMALKSVMISWFREEEIRAWIDLLGTQIPPDLCLFRLNENKVDMFMEIIKKGITFRDIIDTHMGNIRDANPNLARSFSLYVFHGSLTAVHVMHQIGWTHRDLHPGNWMLEELDGEIRIRILDFGMATRIDSVDGSAGFLTDIKHVVSNFTAMYIGFEFNSRLILKTNLKDEVQQSADWYGLRGEDKEELFSLIDMALDVSPDQMPTLQKKVAAKMNTDYQLENELKQVAKILYPESKHLPFPVTSQGQEIEQQTYIPIGTFENTGQSNISQTEAEDVGVETRY